MNNKRLNWKSYRYASVDLQTHEPFRNKQFFVSLKEILRQRRGYSKIKLKFESVLRRHDKLWRNSSVLARKEYEEVSVLKKHRGKKKYRPVLIRQVRENRWHDIACRGRSFNDGISWGLLVSNTLHQVVMKSVYSMWILTLGKQRVMHALF